MDKMNGFSKETVESVGSVLNDPSNSLAERFRALFTLRNIATPEAIDQICSCFADPSALLKHELAYCLGQIQSERALPTLVRVLEDEGENSMVRHEAGEAMAAIGSSSICEVLERFTSDPAPEVAETCQLSLAKLDWLGDKDGGLFQDNNPYRSVDPAPPYRTGGVEDWQRQLTDKSLSLFSRYRALFALRNHGGTKAVVAIASAFGDDSALFKHELAYVLGQMQNPAAIPGLLERLEDLGESPMVRHECAEALGAIASEECLGALERFRGDVERVVRESCEVALDMYRSEKEAEFQYANTVSKVTPQ